MTDVTRPQVDAKLAVLDANVNARLANFDTSIKSGFAEMRAELARIETTMHRNTADIIKWCVTTGIGNAIAMLAILTFVVNNAVDRQARTSTPPTVIVVPASGITPAAPSGVK